MSTTYRPDISETSEILMRLAAHMQPLKMVALTDQRLGTNKQIEYVQRLCIQLGIAPAALPSWYLTSKTAVDNVLMVLKRERDSLPMSLGQYRRIHFLASALGRQPPAATTFWDAGLLIGLYESDYKIMFNREAPRLPSGRPPAALREAYLRFLQEVKI